MRVDVLGVGFDPLTLSGAAEKAVTLMESGGYVVTPNPEIVCRCLENPGLLAAVNSASLVLADGIGIVKASRKLGRPLPERAAGFDFANSLFPLLVKKKKKLFLLGSKPGIAEMAASKLMERYPGLDICGVNDGYFKDDRAMAEKIKNSKADVVYVCLGSPKQELWMSENRSYLEKTLLVGLGGSIDHWAGIMKRAPALFRKLGLEWLYRFLRYPGRIGRAVFIPVFLGKVNGQRKKERKNS